MRKLLICTPLGTFPAFIYIWAAITPELLNISSFKFSAFLSCMGANKCVKFQRPRCTGLKVSIFQIRPIVLFTINNIKNKEIRLKIDISPYGKFVLLINLLR